MVVQDLRRPSYLENQIEKYAIQMDAAACNAARYRAAVRLIEFTSRWFELTHGHNDYKRGRYEHDLFRALAIMIPPPADRSPPSAMNEDVPLRMRRTACQWFRRAEPFLTEEVEVAARRHRAEKKQQRGE